MGLFHSAKEEALGGGVCLAQRVLFICRRGGSSRPPVREAGLGVGGVVLISSIHAQRHILSHVRSRRTENHL